MFQRILPWQAFPTNDRILEGHNTTILELLKIDKNMFNYQFERIKWERGEGRVTSLEQLSLVVNKQGQGSMKTAIKMF